jgi:hypothetical protein
MVCSKSNRGRYASPALAVASYPFVDLPSGNTLQCKLFPADKFAIHLFPKLDSYSIIRLTVNWILKKWRRKMKKTVLVFMILVTMLTGCNNAKTSSNETINETNISETAEISEEARERTPFEVLIDKPSLESGKEKETTVIIVTDIKDWDYTVSSENGKISNKEENSFVYAVPKDESEREDTITIQLSDNENGTSYEYTIPLIFANSILQ